MITTASGYLYLPVAKTPICVVGTSCDTGDNNIIGIGVSNFEYTRFLVKKAHNGSEFPQCLATYIII